jgi:hypothetical protein
LREFYHRLGREIADSKMFARSLRATLRNLDNARDAKSLALQRLGELRQNGLNRLARRALQSRDLSRELNGVNRCHDTCSALFKFCGTGVTPNDRAVDARRSIAVRLAFAMARPLSSELVHEAAAHYIDE